MNDDILVPPGNNGNTEPPKAENDRPPENNATTETKQTDTINEPDAEADIKPAKKRLHWPKLEPHNFTRKQWIILGSALGALIIVGSVAGFFLNKHFAKFTRLDASAYKYPAISKDVPSPLTGVKVSPALAKRPITGIMIENSPDARPQSGLKDAGVVFEAIAEGGITRFLALYQEATPSYIGPVRSARPYYLDFVLPFEAALAHVGGSPDALQDIKKLKVRDLDQFANSEAYWRITERYSPHNVYTSMSRLDALKKKKGYTKSKFGGFLRKKKELPVKSYSAKSVNFAISGLLYNVHYDYNKKANAYLRSEGGKPHIDEKSKKQLKPKVVIALVMDYGFAGDGHHSKYTTTGSGTMFVFQDGSLTQGTWQKKSRQSQLTFKDAQGKEIALNPGQTWITLVNARSDVTYKP